MKNRRNTQFNFTEDHSSARDDIGAGAELSRLWMGGEKRAENTNLEIDHYYSFDSLADYNFSMICYYSHSLFVVGSAAVVAVVVFLDAAGGADWLSCCCNHLDRSTYVRNRSSIDLNMSSMDCCHCSDYRGIAEKCVVVVADNFYHNFLL